jgi:hypothetical protein
MTPGKALSAALVRYFSIGPRTKRFRRQDGAVRDLHFEIVETCLLAAHDPLYFGPGCRDALSLGGHVGYAYEKHVRGCRLDGVKIARIQALSPYRFAELLGQMVDAGVTHSGSAEDFFRTY